MNVFQILDAYFDTVLAKPDEILAAHHRMVLDVGKDEQRRKEAINLVFDWAQHNADTYSSDQFTQRASIAATTLQQLFVRYQALAHNSPYGPLLNQTAQSLLQKARSEPCVRAIRVLTICLTICEVILGLDPQLLEDCVQFLDDLYRHGRKSVENVADKVTHDVFCDTLRCLSRFENLLSTSKNHLKVDNIFNELRLALVRQQLLPGVMSACAMTAIENRAIREHLQNHPQSNYAGGDYPSSSNLDNEGMDEEAEKEYEQFMKGQYY